MRCIEVNVEANPAGPAALGTTAETPTPIDLEQFCAGRYPKLVGFLGYCTGDRAVAEELAQETLVRAVQHWEHVRAMDSPDGWLYRTGLNLARSRFRRRGAERRAYDRMEATRDAARGAAEESGADSLDLHAQIRALPYRQRAAIVSRYFLDLPVRDVAALMGCSEAAVKSLLRNALAHLRLATDTEELER